MGRRKRDSIPVKRIAITIKGRSEVFILRNELLVPRGAAVERAQRLRNAAAEVLQIREYHPNDGIVDMPHDHHSPWAQLPTSLTDHLLYHSDHDPELVDIDPIIQFEFETAVKKEFFDEQKMMSSNYGVINDFAWQERNESLCLIHREDSIKLDPGFEEEGQEEGQEQVQGRVRKRCHTNG
jgi:hypothetical protein